jgi:hypothetical protein
MKTNILLFAAIIFAGISVCTTRAQTPGWLWAKSVVSTGNNDGAYSVTAVDNSGNVYVAGDFTSSSAAFGSIILKSAGDGDMFLAKYNAQGEVIWAKSAGGKFFDAAAAIATDASGNVYVAGRNRSSTITFGSATLSGEGLFLVKYDGDGNMVWAKNVTGKGFDYANSIALDAAGNIYVAGGYGSATLTIGNSVLTNAGGSCIGGCSDIFIAKFDAGGNPLWAKSAGGNASDYALSVATDTKGNIYLGGGFYSLAINIGAVTLTRNAKTAVVAGDLFLAKYNPEGNLLWAKNAGNNNDEKINSIATDAVGNAYVAGSFKSHTFNLGTFTLTKASNMAGYSNMFVAKFDDSGKVVWAKCAGGKGTDEARSIVIDASGDIFVTGIFTSSSITIGNTILKNDRNGFYDIFLAKYNAQGNELWTGSVGNKNMDESTCLAADRSGNIYLTGRFGVPDITFGTTILKSTYNSVSLSYNIFVAKLKSK